MPAHSDGLHILYTVKKPLTHQKRFLYHAIRDGRFPCFVDSDEDLKYNAVIPFSQLLQQFNNATTTYIHNPPAKTPVPGSGIMDDGRETLTPAQA